MNPDPQKSHTAEVWKGIGLCALLHLLLFVFPMLFFFIGVVQLVYILPAALWFKFKKNNTAIMQGLLIGAGVTFLLNAACFGIVFSGFADFGFF